MVAALSITQISRARAAADLGISERMLAYYEAGEYPTPRAVLLATRALAVGLGDEREFPAGALGHAGAEPVGLWPGRTGRWPDAARTRPRWFARFSGVRAPGPGPGSRADGPCALSVIAIGGHARPTRGGGTIPDRVRSTAGRHDHRRGIAFVRVAATAVCPETPGTTCETSPRYPSFR